MQNTVVCGRYRVGEQVRTGEGWTEFRGKDQSGQAVIIRQVDSEKEAVSDLLLRLEAVREKLGLIPEQSCSPWLEICEHEGSVLIISREVRGKSLPERIDSEGPLPFEDVIELAYGLAVYLRSLHGEGLLQGAFPPGDLVFATDAAVPVVTAPALAAYLDLSAVPASGGLCLAPELVTGQAPDACSDVYALGAVLYLALTARAVPAPPPAPDLSSGKTMIVTWLPGRLRTDIPEALDQLVGACLHPERENRFTDPDAVLAVLEGLRPQAEIPPPPMTMGMEDSLVGQTLGPYRLVERLGQGGMAAVYKGYEPALNRYVAIKVLPQFFANDPNFTARFHREAKAVAQLTHPNIVPIYNFGEDNGITYIAMQLVHGGSLKYESGDRMGFREALQLLLPITRALGYAHQRGVVHRDVKPSNVLISEDGWPVLADFGLAKMAESTGEKLTGTGVGMGTPMYMSPEQGQGVNVDHRSDIYSLGIMLYELVTGDVPFRADTPMAIVIKHMTAPMPMPRSVNPDIPEAVESIILKATAKDKEDRFQTAEEMVEVMERVLAGSPLPENLRMELPQPSASAPAKQQPAQPEKKPRRKPKPLQWVLYAILGIMGACLLGVVMMGVFDICPPQGPWPQPPWCEGSPFQFSMGGSDSGQPSSETVQAVLTSGTFGPVLFKESFEETLSDRWQFTCDPQTSPWILDEIDRRAVFRSQPSTRAGGPSCAEVRGTDWLDYAQKFDFKFYQPDRFGIHSFDVKARIINCPQHIQSIHAYTLYVSSEGLELMKSTCSASVETRVIASSDRDISVDEWHTMYFIVVGNRIQVLLDGEIHLDYIDEEEPLLEGGDLWFQSTDQAELLLDDLTIFEVIPAAGEEIILPE